MNYNTFSYSFYLITSLLFHSISHYFTTINGQKILPYLFVIYLILIDQEFGSPEQSSDGIKDITGLALPILGLPKL
ncbi:MAG: hypothetical protein KAH84_08375, partial [Thiomargarita sp.]|nr:hypothetical protein [Thiomargarita sp.]